MWLTDIAQPPGSDTVTVQASAWDASTETDKLSRFQLTLWQPLLDEVDFVEHAAFYFIRGELTGLQGGESKRFDTELGFRGPRRVRGAPFTADNTSFGHGPRTPRSRVGASQYGSTSPCWLPTRLVACSAPSCTKHYLTTDSDFNLFLCIRELYRLLPKLGGPFRRKSVRQTRPSSVWPID